MRASLHKGNLQRPFAEAFEPDTIKTDAQYTEYLLPRLWEKTRDP